MKSTGIIRTADMLSINAMLKNNTILITSTFTRDTKYLFMGILINKKSLKNNQDQSQIHLRELIDTEKKITFRRVWKFEEMNTKK